MMRACAKTVQKPRKKGGHLQSRLFVCRLARLF
jgi:hypothetical protein